MKTVVLTSLIFFVALLVQAQDFSKFGEEIKFGNNSDKIFSSSNTSLDKLVAKMKSDKDLKIRITGYADNNGTEESKSKLSKDRANAVKKYLLDKGIEEIRITSVGYNYANATVKSKTVKIAKQVEITKLDKK